IEPSLEIVDTVTFEASAKDQVGGVIAEVGWNHLFDDQLSVGNAVDRVHVVGPVVWRAGSHDLPSRVDRGAGKIVGETNFGEQASLRREYGGGRREDQVNEFWFHGG